MHGTGTRTGRGVGHGCSSRDSSEARVQRVRIGGGSFVDGYLLARPFATRHWRRLVTTRIMKSSQDTVVATHDENGIGADEGRNVAACALNGRKSKSVIVSQSHGVTLPLACHRLGHMLFQS